MCWSVKFGSSCFINLVNSSFLFSLFFFFVLVFVFVSLLLLKSVNFSFNAMMKCQYIIMLHNNSSCYYCFPCKLMFSTFDIYFRSSKLNKPFIFVYVCLKNMHRNPHTHKKESEMPSKISET